MRLHLIAAVMLVSLQANASIEQQVIQCSAITKEPQRLACYDTLAANIHSTNAVTPTQPITTVAPIAPIGADRCYRYPVKFCTSRLNCCPRLVDSGYQSR